jgi:hypothetical protein
VFRLFFQSLTGYLRLGIGCLNPRATLVRWSVRRLAVLCLFFPLFLLVQLWHWLGLAIDELLFRGYRQIDIRRPVFIVGAPRSGTTFVHRSMAADEERFTTFATWEVFFAHSITARYLILGLARIDQMVGRPLARLLAWLERRVLSRLDDLHPMTLDSPEEDYLTLTPILACFILVVPFPFASRLWRLARFDVALAPAVRHRILQFYCASLQRHLYVFGRDRQLLSKNAAFASWIQGLADFFPEAFFIHCHRAPVESVPSLLSSMQDGLRFFSVDQRAVETRLVDAMEFYYRHLPGTVVGLAEGRAASIAHDELRKRPREVLLSVYRQLGFEPGDEYCGILDDIAERSGDHRSKHRYSLGDFGLSERFFAERFAAADPSRVCRTEAA